MRGPHLNTFSPFWKTTSQPQSRSTSQGTTSRLWAFGLCVCVCVCVLGVNPGITKRYISGNQSSGRQRVSTHGIKLRRLWRKMLIMLQTSPRPHWYICEKQEENVFRCRALCLVYPGTKCLEESNCADWCFKLWEPC